MPPKKAAPKQGAKKPEKNGGSKAKKKKWSKGKTREALENAVLFDKDTYAKLTTEVPKWKVITPSVVSDRLKISVALAGSGLKHLAYKGLVRLVSSTGHLRVYTRQIVAEAPAEEKK